MANKSAEVRRFTGFIAIDGSTHNTEAAAVNHTLGVKTRKALTELAESLFEGAKQLPDGFAGLTVSDTDDVSINSPECLVNFLIANKADIQAAFNQEVRKRAPRKAKKIEAGAAAAA